MFKFLLIIFLILKSTYCLSQNMSLNSNHVNILMYHRFDESKYPSTNIKLDQFLQHLNEIKKKEYNVIDLMDAIEAIKKERKIPDRSLSITIDDAYLSVYKTAWPLLKKNNFPFTLFVSTEVIDKNLPNYMSWDQIRELLNHGVRIGSQTRSHPHMHRLSIKQQNDEIEYSNKRFLDEIGFKPILFAYPYGEYNLETIEIVREKGFVAAFGQHSGVAHLSLGLYELPRWAMNENYGDLNRLKLLANALPMSVSDISPKNPFIKNNPPNFGFTLNQTIKDKNVVRCFASNQIKSKTIKIGKSRIEVRLEKPFPKKRGRVNCTMATKEGRWRWFGKQFMTE